MKDLKELLTNPFDGISSEVGFKKKCQEIAKELFCNYCIECDEAKYYFAEIEFYYFEKGKWAEEWNKVTYPRNDYNAGDLFYHLSGIDVCFNSVYNKKEAKYGGILIRAIKNAKEGKITAGPLNSKDEMLNACRGEKMPRVTIAETKQSLTPEATYRALGKDALEKGIDKSYKLCFFDGNIPDWSSAVLRYDYKKEEVKHEKRNYKTNRFNAPAKDL